MSFDPYDIPLTTNNWFSTEVVYEGRARAEFEDPKGAAEGPAVVRFDAYGESRVEMSVEDVSTEQPLQFGMTEFFSGEKPVKIDGGTELPLTFRTNPCTRLTVTTRDGVFSSTDVSH